MNKQHTLTYLKYGKLITEINDIIIHQNIRSDMFKFLVNFPELLKYPNRIYQCYLQTVKNTTNRSIAYGRFVFYNNTMKNNGGIEISFDVNNNFQLWTFEELNNYYTDWILINNVNHYMDNHLDIFHNIIN